MNADPWENNGGLDTLEDRLGYRFKDRDIFVEALTHSSYANEHRGESIRPNERLEFLGDAVLDLLVSDMLIADRPDASEGELSKTRSLLVSETSLSAIGSALGLGPLLRLGKGEELSGGREKKSLLADAFEAVLGAVYLDGGLEAARRLVEAHFCPVLAEPGLLGRRDFKTFLQELCQGRGLGLPVYRVVEEEGPDHAKTFRVDLVVDGVRRGTGTGRNKKEAEQDAARIALDHLSLQDEKAS